MKNKPGIIIIVLLAAAGIYLLSTSLERVPAGEVKVVMELGVDSSIITLQPRPLVNENGRARWFFKQPKIPFLGIGYLKESFRIDDGWDFSASFAYYTLDEITGDRGDSETVKRLHYKREDRQDSRLGALYHEDGPVAA